jgi:glutamate-1-semialdehyde 2,1-aminomutase
LQAGSGAYEALAAATERLAAEMAAAAERHEVDCRISAFNSIFSLSFSHKRSRYYRERVSGSNFKATIALAYYMRKRGVYLPELHSFLLSMAHTEADIDQVIAAFAGSLGEMREDGLFET